MEVNYSNWCSKKNFWELKKTTTEGSISIYKRFGFNDLLIHVHDIMENLFAQNEIEKTQIQLKVVLLCHSRKRKQMFISVEYSVLAFIYKLTIYNRTFTRLASYGVCVICHSANYQNTLYLLSF